MSPTGGTGRRALLVASACFILSGAAALVYQVSWQRLLALTTGASIPSIAAITAAFMAGLGIGSHAGGVWSERLSRRAAIKAFALVEFGVSAFASVSVWIYYRGLYQSLPGLYDHGPALTFLVHLLALILPTTLMGMSLPLLVRGLVLSSEGAARTIGFLYAANAFGAAAGAFATPWLLLRFLGVDGAVFFGAGLSGAAALGAWILSRNAEADTTRPSAPDPTLFEGNPEGAQTLGIWVALYGLSGFIALALELAWFRVLDVMAKGAAFTFGTLLGVYLVGLASGTLVATLTVSRVRRPLRTFMVCQGLMLVATLLAHTLLVHVPPSGTPLEWMVGYGAGAGPGSFIAMDRFETAELVYLYLGMPLALFGPATFLMGFGFPILQRAIQGDPVVAGRRVGLLQAVNILGCTLGSLVTGLFLFDAIGTAGVFKVLGFLGFAVTLAGAYKLKAPSLWAIATGLAVLLATFPNNHSLWLRLHGNPDSAGSIFEEDAASVTGFSPRTTPKGHNLWLNGRSISYIPYGSIHTILGAVPALVHPNPQDVAIIGLGSGDTAWAAGLRAETETITVFEIAASLPRLLERMRENRRGGPLDQFLSDPRLKVVLDDGRRRIARDGIKYDIIEADALYSDSSLAGNLYSVEYYQLVSRALKPGGILCAWMPTSRSEASAARVFRYAIRLPSLMVLSNQPLALDKTAWIARLESERTRGYLGGGRVGPIRAALDAAQLFDPAEMLPYEINEDLQPRDEYARPRKRRRPSN